MAKYSYTVKGSGVFPIDMLRYDETWPAQYLDVILMMPHETERREVHMLSDRYPTLGRWDSWCWTVSNVVTL
jgi:hypothetical protein